MSPRRNRVRYSRDDFAFNLISYTVIAILILVCFYPLWYVACASITDPGIVASSGGILLWPGKIDFSAYARVLANPEIWSGYANTILYTVTGTALSIFLTAMLAFSLSHKKMVWGKPLTLLVTFTMFFNGGLIPTYLVVRSLGLINHRFAVILPGIVTVFNFIFMRTQFEALPEAIEESAKLDGANHWTIFAKIILPVSSSAIAVMVLFNGVALWNDWFSAMIYLPNQRDFWPLALITREIIISSTSAAMSEGSVVTQEVADTIRYATIIVSILPILCVYPFLQKHFVKGAMVGAVKG